MGRTHSHAPWRKTVLIPFWTLQILFMLGYIALLALTIDSLASYKYVSTDSNYGYLNNSAYEAVKTARDVVLPVWIGLCAMCLILTTTEIILLARRKLHPLTFLVMNAIKSTVWIVLLILDIIWTVTASRGTSSGLGLVLQIILISSFFIPLIYGSVIYHRLRRDKNSYESVPYPISYPANMTYQPQFTPYAAQVTPGELGNDMPGVRTDARRKSFNHERDTRFDTYRKSMSSARGPTELDAQ